MQWFEFLKNAHESVDFEEYIDKHWKEFSADNIWSKICMEPLEESFIRTHIDLVDWKLISRKSVLTEPFMEEFSHKLDWKGISACQNMSKKFIYRHREKLDWSSVLMRYQFPEVQLLELINDPTVSIDIGNVINTQSALAQETVQTLKQEYEQQEIQRNINRRKNAQ